MTEIDIFSAMLTSTEIVDIKRFTTPWKLVSYSGLSPSTRESSGKTKNTPLKNESNKKFYYNLIVENNYLKSSATYVITGNSKIARAID